MELAFQTWIQDLLIQDQDQDFDVQDQDRDSRLTRPILEVDDWDGLWQTKKTEKVMASRKSSITVVAHRKQQNVPCLTTVLFRQCIKLWHVHTTFQKYDVWSTAKALMFKFFWSYNYRLITTVQQHENLQLVVASQVDQLWQHVVTHSSPVCPYQQTTVAKYPFHRSRGGRLDRRLFLAMDDFLFCLNFTLHEWRRPSLHGPKS